MEIKQTMDKWQLRDMIKTQTRKDLSGLLKEIIKDFIDKDDLYGLYSMFNSIYDDLYYDIIFKKIKINKETAKILEVFATPIYQKTTLEQKRIIGKYI